MTRPASFRKVRLKTPADIARIRDAGRAIAEKIYERHTVLSKVLIGLGVPEKIAVEDACKIEHDISDETFELIKKHIAAYEEAAK